MNSELEKAKKLIDEAHEMLTKLRIKADVGGVSEHDLYEVQLFLNTAYDCIEASTLIEGKGERDWPLNLTVWKKAKVTEYQHFAKWFNENFRKQTNNHETDSRRNNVEAWTL
jgi:hypothetical protein